MSENNNSRKMGLGAKIAIIAVLAAAVIAVMVFKNAENDQQEYTRKPETISTKDEYTEEIITVEETSSEPVVAVSVPKLVDLGAETCRPCKMMAPILEDLKKTYAGRMDVEFIDVRKRPEAGRQYGIKLIPTQIFLDAMGNELFRHEGFYSKDDILNKWNELNISFDTSSARE